MGDPATTSIVDLYCVDGTWGQNDGKPGNLRPENLVSEHIAFSLSLDP